MEAIKMEQLDRIGLDLGDQDSFDAPFRARSNTWPLHPKSHDLFGEPSNEELDACGGAITPTNDQTSANNLLTTISDSGLVCDSDIPTTAHEASSLDQLGNGATTNGCLATGPKKNTSRRNAWGNMSYADLITQAIQSSPDKRLTLSQIYDWMVQNVPYFKDKGDSNSSAGWKNSIRHNLSLHNRFMRVQNEGTGKSSWWMINPDAKPGKAARRRATSMETSKYEKKRGRVKKKVEALRNGTLTLGENTSPSSSVSEGLDVFPDSPLHHSFQLSPDFRPRTTSNASSCGRLSPIPAVESDMHDSQVPPLSPLSGWSSDLSHLYPSEPQPQQPLPDQYNAEQLVEMANTHMKLGNGFLGVSKSSPTGQLSPASSHATLMPLTNFGGSSVSVNSYTGSGGTLSRNGSDPYFQQSASGGIESNITLTTLNSINGPRSPSRGSLLSSDAGLTPNNSFSLSPAQSMDTLAVVPSSNANNSSTFHSPQHQQQQQQSGISCLSSTKCAQNRGAYGDISLMRAMAAQQQPNEANGVSPQHHSQQQQQCNNTNGGIVSSAASLGATASQVMGHLFSLNNPQLPNDLDFDSLQGGLECDVEQVVQHELRIDGNLDFNFDPMAQSVSTSMASRSWVH